MTSRRKELLEAGSKRLPSDTEREATSDEVSVLYRGELTLWDPGVGKRLVRVRAHEGQTRGPSFERAGEPCRRRPRDAAGG